MDYKEYFKDKRITLIGLGLLGRGVNDTAFLSEYGASVIVTDLKSEAELKSSLDKLKGYQNIEYALGEHKEEDFINRDMILKSAGIPLDSKYIETAKAHNIPIEMSASLVAKLTDATIVGVTGTRGKSTVTQLIYHILQSAGKDVHLAGNVRGIGTLQVLEHVNKDSIILMELDSWQLQGFGTSYISPSVSVFTTFYPDHMDYYKNDMQIYFDDKANIFMNQKKGDILITTKQSRVAIDRYSPVVPNNEIVVEPFVTENPSLLGEHNKENAGCAAEVARNFGVSEKEIKNSIDSFEGIEGRLQFVREVDGVKIYNDNNATSPEATIVALEALQKNIILILGGVDKGLKMHKLIEVISKHCKAVVLFNESGTERIKDEIMELENVNTSLVEGLEACVQKAVEIAQSDDIVLYSPSFASFGKYFKNEYDRNDQFMSIVESL